MGKVDNIIISASAARTICLVEDVYTSIVSVPWACLGTARPYRSTVTSP